ncbi:glucosyltransferase domain-containing protein [uncultured Subdoligranulum sp.]|uniref:glucosyltransferase domain-containing protein n=1 Tax=uncultured Subdoligranulum sp. TaxID=512298 RepID=UPI0026032065|nr:glucosyltransferase domain-containing protein [uncultured Subdoligranulum sp.]
MQLILDKLEQQVQTCRKRIDLPLLGAVSLAALVSMLLAHGFAFTNLFPNHDSTVVVFDAQWTMYVLGRWAQNIYFPLIRGKIAAPWLIGIFSTVYIAISGYCIASLLRLRNNAAMLMTGLLACCATVTAMLATYNLWTDAHLMGMLLACLGVFCLEKVKPIPGFCVAAVLFCGCLAFYQAYIQFALGLFLLVLVRKALEGTTWRSWLLYGLRALASLAVGAALYLISVKVSLAMTGYQLADTGNGLAQLTRLGPAAILTGIPAVYQDFFEKLLGYSGWNDRGMRVAAALLLLLSLWGLFLRLRGQTGRGIAQSLLAVALLPFGLNVIYLLASGNVYILMQHAIFLVYALPWMLFGSGAPEAPRALWRWCVGALCAFLVLRMVICANGAYVYTKLVYDQTARQMSVITAEVQQLPGYEEGVTPIAFVGDFTQSNFAYRDPAFSRYEEGDLHQVPSAVTYDGTIKWWFQHVMGSSAAVIADQAQLDAWAEDERVQAMPAYPYSGCCAMLDGTAVVKIS